MTKFRHQRHTLAESMETVCEVHSLQELKDLVRCQEITVKPYPEPGSVDKRTGWHTHIVWAEGHIPFGFTDGPLTD